MSKKTLGILALVAVAGGGLGLYAMLRADGDVARRYETALVTRGPIAARVTATGTLSPLVTVQVGSQVSGRIQELFADFNSRVEKGQVIAKIDPRLFESDVAKARANLAVAAAAVKRTEAQLVDAKLKHERTSSLAAKAMVAQSDADTTLATYGAATAEVASANASLAQAQAALEQAETQLAYTTIVSPIDGIVISRDVDVGQTVAASLQAPTLFTIAEDLRKMEVHTNVAEADVGRLEREMTVEFMVDAYPTDRFRGVVQEIRYAPQIIQNVVTYDAVVAVANPELKLRPGMTADVTFLVQERADALLVPNAALRFRPPPEVLEQTAMSPVGPDGPEAASAPGKERNSRRVVWKLDGEGRPQSVRVRIGITDGRLTEIVGLELHEGETVITGIGGDGSSEPEAQPSRRFGRFL